MSSRTQIRFNYRQALVQANKLPHDRIDAKTSDRQHIENDKLPGQSFILPRKFDKYGA